MLFVPIKQFESEEDAKEAAQIELLNILNNKSYLVPDKFSGIISEYRKKQTDYNNEINVAIKNQIENIDQSTKLLDESSQSLEKAKSEYQNLNKFWESSIEFHNDMDIYEKVLIYRRNVSNFLDQIKYFLNISTQILKLEELFIEGEENFDYIHYKLLALCELRDNVISKMNENQAKTEDLKKIFKEFEVLESFEAKFYVTLFDSIANARVMSKKNPVQLIKMIKIIENGDNLLESEGKPTKFRAKCVNVIQKSIDKRFDEELSSSKNINETLEKLQFTVSDLIEVMDHVVKCFPKKYDIFKVYEEGYKFLFILYF